MSSKSLCFMDEVVLDYLTESKINLLNRKYFRWVDSNCYKT